MYGKYCGSIEFSASNTATWTIAAGRVTNTVAGLAPGTANAATMMRFHSSTTSAEPWAKAGLHSVTVNEATSANCFGVANDIPASYRRDGARMANCRMAPSGATVLPTTYTVRRAGSFARGRLC